MRRPPSFALSFSPKGTRFGEIGESLESRRGILVGGKTTREGKIVTEQPLLLILPLNRALMFEKDTTWYLKHTHKKDKKKKDKDDRFFCIHVCLYILYPIKLESRMFLFDLSKLKFYILRSELVAGTCL